MHEHNLHYTMHLVWHCIMPHDATCTICYINVCGVYDSHILHGASQSACCCKSNTCSIPVMVTQCNASDGVLREHAKGHMRRDALSCHAFSACDMDKRHVHLARRKRAMVPRPCSCGMMENKPNSPLLVDAREGRLSVLLACCPACDMERRCMGIVRRKRDVTRRMIARCTMPHACCCQAWPSGQGQGGACTLLAGACRSVLLTRDPTGLA